MHLDPAKTSSVEDNALAIHSLPRSPLLTLPSHIPKGVPLANNPSARHKPQPNAAPTPSSPTPTKNKWANPNQHTRRKMCRNPQLGRLSSVRSPKSYFVMLCHGLGAGSGVRSGLAKETGLCAILIVHAASCSLLFVWPMNSEIMAYFL